MSAALNIAQITVPVRNVERAIAFYSDVLGLSLLFTSETGMAFFECGPVRIVLSRTEISRSASNNAVMYYTVDDIERSFIYMHTMGAKPVQEPQLCSVMPDHEVWTAQFEDGEGNLIGLQEVRYSLATQIDNSLLA